LALYDQILTGGNPQFGIHRACETKSEAQQHLLREGLRKLISVGISKDEAKISSYSDGKVKRWITVSDFKKIFLDSIEFEFTLQKIDYKLPLYEVWDLLFLGGSFDNKLYYINEKVQKYKDAEEAGKNPYMTLLEDKYLIAIARFLEPAEAFAFIFERLIDKNLFIGPHSYTDLVDPWQLRLMRIAFGL